MEWNIVLAVIFCAVTVVGGVETTYQIYKLTVLDAVGAIGLVLCVGVLNTI